MRTRKYPINYTAKIIFGIVDISKQRYNSFMRFEKGFLGKLGETFCWTAGYLVYLRLCPAAGHIATNLK